MLIIYLSGSDKDIGFFIEELSCPEEMEQDQQAKDLVVAEVWGEVRAKVEVEWAGHSPQGREEIAYARNVATKFLML
jgi:hypothetical protein